MSVKVRWVSLVPQGRAGGPERRREPLSLRQRRPKMQGRTGTCLCGGFPSSFLEVAGYRLSLALGGQDAAGQVVMSCPA